jgi:peptidoglycan/LPS O-acetylase OafA/YrhL
VPNLHYRPEIDGLRAIAVIGVVLYHVGLGFPGGYVGVDVFFVISGYLITGIIMKDLHRGTFSMLDFWVRRIRRILPAVTATVIACLILGYLILEAEDYEALAKSSVAQSLMAANIFFWLDNMSYFAEASDMKPLLHTWSLAVEEQFYVIFPLFLSLLSKRMRKYTLPAIICIGVGSLALSCWGVIHKPGANFFLLPTRAWELMVGAGIALMPKQKDISGKVAELGAWMGLVMIAAAMFLYDAKTPFPGWTAILPVAGSGFFIWSNNERQTSAGKILALRPLVFVGLISYSFYLWHWPILVFTKHVITDDNLSWKLAVLLVSLIVSIASWKYVETPFRKKGVLCSRSSVFKFAAVSSISLILISSIIWRVNGLPGRYDGDLDLFAEDVTWKGSEYVGIEKEPVNIGLLSASDELAAKPDFVVWGDSHAQVIAFAIDKVAAKHRLKGACYINHSRIPVAGLTTARFSDHITYTELVIKLILESKARNVILVARWSDPIEGKNAAELASAQQKFPSGLMEQGDRISDMSPERTAELLTKHLESTARQLKSKGITVWLIKQVPESNNVSTASEFYRAKRFTYLNDMPAQYTILRNDHERRQMRVNRAIDSVPAGLMNVIDPTPYFFKNTDRLKVYGDRSYYRDDDHLTRAGADHYLSEMFDSIFTKIAKDQKDNPGGE